MSDRQCNTVCMYSFIPHHYIHNLERWISECRALRTDNWKNTSQEPLLNCTSKQGFNQISLHVLSSLVEASGTSELHWLYVKQPAIQVKFKPIIFSHSTVRFSSPVTWVSTFYENGVPPLPGPSLEIKAACLSQILLTTNHKTTS